MSITTKFGETVRIIRHKKNMSQGDLAKKLNVHPTYISKIERGIQNPSLRGIEKIAKALGVRPEELLK